MRRSLAAILILTTNAAAMAANPPFVFEERPGHAYNEASLSWRDALLRASIRGCKERLPRGSRLRPRIRDCVVNQVHVTNLSAHALECRVTLVFAAPDDDGRRHVEQTIHIAAGRERWVATAYGPAALEPQSFSTSCAAAAAAA